jgi:hypothetical protein
MYVVFDDRPHPDIHVDGAEKNESDEGGANSEAADRGNDKVAISSD